MCTECNHEICSSNCPNYEPHTAYIFCDHCDDYIFENDGFYKIDGLSLCAKCGHNVLEEEYGQVLNRYGGERKMKNCEKCDSVSNLQSIICDKILCEKCVKKEYSVYVPCCRCVRLERIMYKIEDEYYCDNCRTDKFALKW